MVRLQGKRSRPLFISFFSSQALSLGAKYKEFDLKIIWWDKLINKNNKTNNNNNNNNNNNKDNSGGEKANDDDADVDKENNNKEAHLMANNNANAVNDAKNNFTNKLVYNNSDTNNTDDNSNSKVCKNASIEGTVSLNKDDDSGIKKPTTDKDDKNSNDDKRGDSGGDADDDGRVGDEEEDEDEDGKKTDASWLGSYFEDFHQNLDYEEVCYAFSWLVIRFYGFSLVVMDCCWLLWVVMGCYASWASVISHTTIHSCPRMKC